MLAGAFVLLVSAACDSEGGDTGESAPATATATTVSTTSIATIPITTAAATTPGATAPSTTAAASTTSVVTSTTLQVGERADELLAVWASGVLAIHDPDTGSLRRVLATVASDGQYAYGPVRGGGTTYMGMSFEDSWYSCEASQGSMIAVAPGGQVAAFGPGGGPVISADGMQLAYLRSSECRPDPAEPDLYVVVVTDTVVVRDLATAEERSWTFPGAFTDGSLAPVVDSVVWYGNSLLAFVGGRLGRIDPGDPAVPASADGTAVTLSAAAPDYLTLLGARNDGTIVAQMNVVESGETTLRIVTLDPATGRVTSEVAALEPTLTKVDRSGMRWAAIVNGTVIVDGREMILEPPPLPPELVADFQDRPEVVGW